MPSFIDGPSTRKFTPLILQGNTTLQQLSNLPISAPMRDALPNAPTGQCVGWGIPFSIDSVVALHDRVIDMPFEAVTSRWLVFLHTSDSRPVNPSKGRFIPASSGRGRLAEHAANYVIRYADGSEESIAIRRLHQLGGYYPAILDKCFEAVACHKPFPREPSYRQACTDWGMSQRRIVQPDFLEEWTSWLWAWNNPRPEVPVVGVRFEPVSGFVLVSAISAGDASEYPLRWRSRRKALLQLRDEEEFCDSLDRAGLLSHVRLDMGQVISARPRLIYDNDAWTEYGADVIPKVSARDLVIEYTSHPDAQFHLADGWRIDVSELENRMSSGPLTVVEPAGRSVEIRVEEKRTGRPVPARLHIHGEHGEPLMPVDRHRIVNPTWYEDPGTEVILLEHSCSYISGAAVVKVPLGRIWIEVSRGFEYRPVRCIARVTPQTTGIVVEIERELPWRLNGWITADTPGNADECLVRVGTENRQHVLGHISLLGYCGPIITPLSTSGPDESALGDPVDALLTDWARQSHRQGGLAVIPHFAHPRAEAAASIVNGDIDPYALSDWYRYLNCGYALPIVGGTDKESATTTIGTIRTYARIGHPGRFTYDEWMSAVRGGETFVSFGPLVELTVDGHPIGGRVKVPEPGTVVEVEWTAASVTMPMSHVELVVSGEVRKSEEVSPWQENGRWSVTVEESCWFALAVLGHYEDTPETVVAHTSPIIVEVAHSPLFSRPDAETILDQIDGSLLYLKTIATRLTEGAHERMLSTLKSVREELQTRIAEFDARADTST
jgi:hypothetical protein